MSGKTYVVSIQKPISKENRVEWGNEKRAKELARRGYKTDAIHAMMYRPGSEISGRKIEKWIKKERSKNDMHMDGRL